MLLAKLNRLRQHASLEAFSVLLHIYIYICGDTRRKTGILPLTFGKGISKWNNSSVSGRLSLIQDFTNPLIRATSFSTSKRSPSFAISVYFAEVAFDAADLLYRYQGCKRFQLRDSLSGATYISILLEIFGCLKVDRMIALP